MASTRRHFLSTTGFGLAASSLATAAGSKTSPNDRIQYALIGCGGMGQGDVKNSEPYKSARIIGGCDIYTSRLTRMKELFGSDLFLTRDYREVLAKPEVDAVYIATPDHWHARIAIDAMKAGKDVYVQKPMVQKVAEGLPVIEAEKKTGRILQVGSQRVSSIIYAKAKELYRAGAIGELNMVEVYYDRNSATGAWQYTIPPDATPETVDWDRFIGHAPKRPFEPIRLFRWRNYQDYGTGVAGDLFVHLFSGVHFVLDSLGPNRVYATGGLRYWKDGRDVPDVMLGLFDYPKTRNHPEFTLALRTNFKVGSGGGLRFRFVGSEGEMVIGNGGVTVQRSSQETRPGLTIGTFPKALQAKIQAEYDAKYPETNPTAGSMEAEKVEEYMAPRGYSDNVDHHRVFFDAIRERKPVVEDATFGFRAAGPALLSNMSYFDRKVYEWDAHAMQIKS